MDTGPLTGPQFRANIRPVSGTERERGFVALARLKQGGEEKREGTRPFLVLRLVHRHSSSLWPVLT